MPISLIMNPGYDEPIAAYAMTYPVFPATRLMTVPTQNPMQRGIHPGNDVFSTQPQQPEENSSHNLIVTYRRPSALASLRQQPLPNLHSLGLLLGLILLLAYLGLFSVLLLGPWVSARWDCHVRESICGPIRWTRFDARTEDGVPFPATGPGPWKLVHNIKRLLERLQAVVVVPTKRDGGARTVSLASVVD